MAGKDAHTIQRLQRHAQRNADIERMCQCTQDTALINGLRKLGAHLNSEKKRTYAPQNIEAVKANAQRSQAKTMGVAFNRYRRWTNEDVALLDKLDVPDVDVAKKLARTLFAVNTMRVKLKRARLRKEA